jgi:biopolymer transport protein ExbD
MALGKRKKLSSAINLNLIPMIDITSFILLALAILVMTMKKEASLDNILKLPPVLHSSKQDTTQLQIYILPAKILRGGYIAPDSTGLVAFTGKGKAPKECPNCHLVFRTDKGEYISGTLLDEALKPLGNLAKESPEEQGRISSTVSNDRPPAYFCKRCRYEISPYLKLDEIPMVLKAKKKEIVDQLVAAENGARDRTGNRRLSEAEVKLVADEIPLMVKADNKAFYGRILQVINMVKDTSVNIKKFAFVTLAEASLAAKKHEDQDKILKKEGKKKD